MQLTPTQAAPTMTGAKESQSIKTLHKSIYFAQGFAEVLPHKIFCGFKVFQERNKNTRELLWNPDGSPKMVKMPICVNGETGIKISHENAFEHLGTVDKLEALPDVEFIGLPFYAGMSQTANGCHLICLDVDLKRAIQPSKQAVAIECWARANGHYFERSHSGKGFHVFIAVGDTSQLPTKFALDVVGAEVEIFSHESIKCVMLTGEEVTPNAYFEDIAIDLMQEMISIGIDIKTKSNKTASQSAKNNITSITSAILPSALPKNLIADLKNALTFLSSDNYDNWIAIGMALKTLPNDQGRELWHEWSAKFSQYDYAQAQVKWEGFEPTSAGCEVIFKRAQEAGYSNSRAAQQLKEAVEKLKQANSVSITDQATSEISAKKFPIQKISQAVKDLMPPCYVVQGILQKNHLATLTATNNSGKTTFATKLTQCVASGEPLGALQTLQGKVLILSGENSADTNLKFKYLKDVAKANLDNIEVLEMAFELKNGGVEELMQELKGEYALVIVDSLQAYFGSGDFNNNNDQLAHLKACRKLTNLKGNPAVLVLAHPTKSATVLEPYGGGALMNEIDENFTLKMENGIATLSHTKLRQASFAPMSFGLEVVEIPNFEDNFGVGATTTQFTPLSSDLACAIAKDADKVRFQILNLLLSRNLSKAELSEAIFGDRDEKHTSRIYRIIVELRSKKLLTNSGDFELTAFGKKELKKLRELYPPESDLGVQISKFGGLKSA